MEMTLKVTRSGNSDVVVIPASWKRKHGVRTGDRLRFRETPDGDIVLSAIPTKTSDDLRQRYERLRRIYGANPELVAMTIGESKEAAHEREDV